MRSLMGCRDEVEAVGEAGRVEPRRAQSMTPSTRPRRTSREAAQSGIDEPKSETCSKPGASFFTNTLGTAVNTTSTSKTSL